MRFIQTSILALTWLLASCAAPSQKDESGRVSALPPVQHPADNPATPQKLALGKQLFVDPRLSGSGNMACQSCHYRNLGWTDAQVLSRKDNGDLNARHTPSLYNVGYQALWYWDGRAPTLEAQILAAWKGQTGADPDKVAALLNTIPGYRSQFQAAFGTDATPALVTQALAAYLREKVSTDSPWDRYEAGDRRAVSKDAITGFALFSGKGRCVACHVPPYYGNSTFYNIGLEHGKTKPDPGRFNVTKDEADRGAFKTPSLRSVALGAPYFHDGSAATLVDAVRYMAEGGKEDPNRSVLLTPTGLTDREIAQVVAFLESLTSTERWEALPLPN
jgi:cytochrome c peroxidase